MKRLERTLEETQEHLAVAQLSLEETEASRDEEAENGAAAAARLQASEEQLLRTKRERDLLQAERSVWQVARSGIQEELAKVIQRWRTRGVLCTKCHALEEYVSHITDPHYCKRDTDAFQPLPRPVHSASD